MILKSIHKKIISVRLFTLLIMMSVFFPTHPANAGAWGEAIAASIMKQTMESISRTIEGALLGTLKVAAIELLNTQVLQFVGGGSGSESKIITNFEDFIDTVAEEEAERVVVNDFLSQSLRGKGSSANYISADGARGLSGNYDAYLRDIVLDTVRDRKTVSQNDFAECNTSGSDPRTSIREGDFRTISCLLKNEKNNPIGIAIAAENTYNEQYEKTVLEQSVKAQSSGFSPATDKDGNIITPSGSIENLVNDVSTLGNKIIAGANNPGEFLSGVVVSVVNRTVSNLVQKGVGDIQSKIRREIRSVDNQIVGAVNSAERTLGPGAAFIDDINQRTQTVNSSAPKIPSTTGP